MFTTVRLNHRSKPPAVKVSINHPSWGQRRRLIFYLFPWWRTGYFHCFHTAGSCYLSQFSLVKPTWPLVLDYLSYKVSRLSSLRECGGREGGRRRGEVKWRTLKVDKSDILDMLTSVVMLTPAGLALNSQSYLDPSCYRAMTLNNHFTANILPIRENKRGQGIWIFNRISLKIRKW